MYHPVKQESTEDLERKLNKDLARQAALVDVMQTRKLTPGEGSEFDKLTKRVTERQGTLTTRVNYQKRTDSANDRIEGRPHEVLTRDQSQVEWVKRAAENGVVLQSSPDAAPRRVVYHDESQLNEYWGSRIGRELGWNVRNGAPVSGLGEDIPTGTGAAQAIVPQAWSAQVVEYLLPYAVAGQLGISRFIQPTEIYNLPVATGIPSPTWVAEAGSISLDTGSQFAPLQFNSMGGFKDTLLYSAELAMDAYLDGTLPAYLAEQMGRAMALAIDVAMIQGIDGNIGNPGLVNEEGFNYRHYTGDESGTTGIFPPDTSELSVINQAVVGAYAPCTAFLMNHAVAGTMSRLTASEPAVMPLFWPVPRDVEDIPWVVTQNPNVLPMVEDDPASADAVALTGGYSSSIYAGPWNFVHMGLHPAGLVTMVLNERYMADNGQFGLFGFQRFSLRTANAQCFFRTIGVLTAPPEEGE